MNQCQLLKKNLRFDHDFQKKDKFVNIDFWYQKSLSATVGTDQHRAHRHCKTLRYTLRHLKTSYKTFKTPEDSLRHTTTHKRHFKKQ